jgi:hypothetical protein
MRAGAFAAVCVGLSQVGHDLMAARPAPLWAGWAALAGVGAVGYRLADRHRPVWWLLLAVEVTQACLHVWFGYCTPSAPGPRPMHMRMQGGAMRAAGDHLISHGASVSAGMFGAHVLAGCLAALWLYAGERSLWRALRLIAEFFADRTPRFFALIVRAGFPAERCPAPAAIGYDEDEAVPEPAVLWHVLTRRGPPRACVSFARTS